jgi:quercetin dioxygenase-like cupin family protein
VLGPGDDPFLTQTLEVHFVEVLPGHSNAGHGHQNEAAFFILRGHGYEIHDDQRYDWETGDLVVVHTDCVHQHWNLSNEESFLAIVFKAKTAWMYLGLVQQGRSGPIENEERFGEREDWSQLWQPGVEDRKKIVKPDDGDWQVTPQGRIRMLAGPQRPDVRLFSVDAAEQQIPVGSQTGKVWHMADAAVYVKSGSGHTLQWDVEAEIGDRYYARVAKEPSRWDFSAGDVVYIPPNTVHQHVNDGSEPVELISVQNALFQSLGYARAAVLEPAPEYETAGVR